MISISKNYISDSSTILFFNGCTVQIAVTLEVILKIEFVKGLPLIEKNIVM